MIGLILLSTSAHAVPTEASTTTVAQLGAAALASRDDDGVTASLAARGSLGRLGLRADLSVGRHVRTRNIPGFLSRQPAPLASEVHEAVLGIGPRWTWGTASEAFPHLVVSVSNRALSRGTWFRLLDDAIVASPSELRLEVGVQHLSVFSFPSSPLALQGSLGVGARQARTAANYLSPRRRVEVPDHDPDPTQRGLAVTGDATVALLVAASEWWNLSAGVDAGVMRWLEPIGGGPATTDWTVGPRVDVLLRM